MWVGGALMLALTFGIVRFSQSIGNGRGNSQ
jgi:hypothetical protein